MKLLVNTDPWEPSIGSYRPERDSAYVENGMSAVLEVTVEEWKDYLVAKSFVRYFQSRMQDKARKAMVKEGV